MTSSGLDIPTWIDLASIGVGSLQGALFAAGFKRVDLLGVAFIGITTGLGGGLLRDLLLGVPPVMVQNDNYLTTALIAVFVAMLLQRLLQKLDPLITALDALSVGLFAAIGVSKALSMGVSFVPSLLVGVVSAIGGGVVRDMLLRIPVAVMHVGSLYAVAALAGSLVFATMDALDVPTTYTLITSVLVTTLIRLLAVRFGWSLPEQRSLNRKMLSRQRDAIDALEALRTASNPVIPPPDQQSEKT